MDNKPAAGKLRGIIRNYEWGGTTFLSTLLAIPNDGKTPMAEYWLGAHDTASSILLTENGDISLNQFIGSNTERTLGPYVAKKFGRLPFLLKILDVNDMLSIQVHPSKHTAEIEFAEENRKKIPLTASVRNYKDDNHKPELMVALSEFWLLHGFKPVDKLRATLLSVPELAPLVRVFDSSGYDQLYKTVMEMPQQAVNETLNPLLNRIIPLYEELRIRPHEADFWAARAALTFNQPQRSDRGIFSVYFFNLVCLQPGEGIYQDTGVPHAYLQGQNVEIMANSDNVLRGGLTAKHIDVKELMKNVRFDETIPEIIRPEKLNECEKLYRTAAPDFRLTRIQLMKGRKHSFQSVSGEIFLIVEGKIVISCVSGKTELEKGGAAFVAYHEQIIVHALADSDIFRASVPTHTG